LGVRRFFCDNTGCERKTFAERLPGVLKPFARRTHRLTETLCAIGQVLGGEAGSQSVEKLAIPTSADTLLRLVRRAELPSRPTPTVLGVDDWAWKKGQTYGTILVDLERHQVIDLLPDRSADTVVEWLQKHPGIQVISRDRGGIYAEAARRGAPDAVQVADRFHLLVNLRAALERVLIRAHEHLPKVHTPDRIRAPLVIEPALSGFESTLLTDTAPPAAALGIVISIEGEATLYPQTLTDPARPQKPQTEPERIKQARRERRHAHYQAIIALHEQGTSIRGIARQMGVGTQTVRRYLAHAAFPEIAQRRQMPRMLDKFEPYLHQRWQTGCHNAVQLYREICHQSYTGSRAQISRWAAKRRETSRQPIQPQACSKASSEPQPTQHQPDRQRKLSPSQAAWLLLCVPTQLTVEHQAAVEQMCQVSSEIMAAYDLAQGFARMIRTHKAEPLTTWLESASKCGLTELRSFANGVQRDFAAVVAGLSLPWSQGQVEGQVNRLKLLKRQMYGRAKLDLLRQRVLAPT